MSALPPLVAKNQPTNVEPARVGVAGSVSDPPVRKVELLTALPPRVSKVTVLVLAVHCAKSVKAEVFVGE